MSSRRARRTRQRMADGAEHELIRTPHEWYDPNEDVRDEAGDTLLRLLRGNGAYVWLRAMPDGTLRTRMLLPFDPSPETIEALAHYARALGKAVARSGEWDPPPDNPWGDQPVPPGGRWYFS